MTSTTGATDLKDTDKTYPCSGVILAGGLSTRFDGLDKALIRVDGRSILDRLLATFSGLFDETILVTNSPENYLEWDLQIVTDLYAARSSLTGIHAALTYAACSHVFVSACDVPFLQTAVIRALLQAVQPHIDVVIPVTSAGFEPLCAVYSKKCLQTIERNLDRGNFKIQKIFNKLNLKPVSEATLRRLDPELLSFFNLNSPADLERAEALLTRKGTYAT
jgi:molybdopterin-guanine dinucleotide biosynthesis protein A